MDSYWVEQLRARLTEFQTARDVEGTALSIKIRIEAGCFHREHSPIAYEIIDAWVAHPELQGSDFKIEEHETGPEILLWITAGLGIAKGIIDLVVTIVKARAEGSKKGDRASGPLQIIVRGFQKNGEFFEEKIVQIPPDHPQAEKMIRDAFESNLKASDTKKKVKAKNPRAKR